MAAFEAIMTGRDAKGYPVWQLQINGVKIEPLSSVYTDVLAIVSAMIRPGDTYAERQEGGLQAAQSYDEFMDTDLRAAIFDSVDDVNDRPRVTDALHAAYRLAA